MVDRVALLSDLKKLLRLLQDDFRARCDQDVDLGAAARAEWQSTRDAARTAEDYTVWREEWLTQVGAAWLLAAVFVRFMEDNNLITPARLSGPHDRRRLAQDNRTQYFNESPTHSDRDYLLQVFETVAALPAADRLFDRRHNPLWRLGPSGDVATRLIEFWQRIDPASGELVHDFTDPTFDTRFLGDLYQDLSEEARKKYALLQTPEFVEEFILDRTLTPAIEAFGYREVRLIDPACGSGHFLLGAFIRLFEISQRHEPGNNSRELARRALAAVHGVDINPFAVAIARFRLLVAALRVCGISRLMEAPAFPCEVYTGDSLLLGRRLTEMRGLNVPLDPDTAVRRALATEDADALDRVLGQTYHVVVGNPPYITVKDRALNAAYRTRYGSCHMKYSLAVPFMERFFDLAIMPSGDALEPAGYVGMITANSFMKREFGKKLIEEYIPRWDLTHVIDTSGAHIPGHGIPTVILFARHRRPVQQTIRAVLRIRGEVQTPPDPSRGPVWTAIVDQVDRPGSQSAFVSVVDSPRESFKSHPWSLGGGGASELKRLLDDVSARKLADIADSIGITSFTLEDDIYILPVAAARRHGLSRDVLRTMVVGDAIRDWQIGDCDPAVFPYSSTFAPLPEQPREPWYRYLWLARTSLANSKMFGGRTKVESGFHWYEYGRLTAEKLRTPLSITFAFVATHNHFVLDRGGRVFNRSAPVIKLSTDATAEDHLEMLALLNSSSACFWMKQTLHDKGGGGIGGGLATEPWEHFFEFTGAGLLRFPVPATSALVSIGGQLDGLAVATSNTQPGTLLRDGPVAVERLVAAKSEYQLHLGQMRLLQEELDWLSYHLYGLTPEPITFFGALDQGLALGQRAFEIVMARRGSGEVDATWFERNGGTPTVDIPSEWPLEYRRIVEKRIATIEDDPNIGLIEQPEYKRRWNDEPWEVQQERSIRLWLLDRLEAQTLWLSLELVTCGELAGLAKRDADFMQIAEVYRGARDFDVLKLVTELIADEAVPFLPVLRYKDPGMRKRAAWERTWEMQRREDVIDARTSLSADDRLRLSPDQASRVKKEEIGEIPVPPKYVLGDFRSNVFWRLRGKLDVPRERFISYPHVSREIDPSLVVAWAGWDELQQARALSTYYLLVKEHDGWPAVRLTPLLAGLLELIPWLKQWHNDIDPDTGERLGDYFDSFVDNQARALGLTRAAILAWKP